MSESAALVTGVPRVESLSQADAPELDPATRISTGNDSNVYRLGARVAKEYQRLSFADVERYVGLQNAAAEVIPALGYAADISIRGLRYTLTVSKAVPVEALGLSRAGRPLTLSRYVEAPNLEKIMYRPDAFAKYARTDLRDPELKTFGFYLNGLFWSEYPTRVQDEFHYHVCMLSRLLDRELDVSGLYIGKYNAKLAPVSRERRIDLTITDLAVYIDRVEHGQH